MAMTVSDLLSNADAFRRCYPHWPHAEPEHAQDPAAAVRERQQRIRAILSGQSVPRLPGPVPVAVCEPDERTDELAALDRADYDAGEG